MINIVSGPPGSGKTTYVLKNKKRGDVVIDIDLLFQAFTGLPMYDKPEALLGFSIELKRAAILQACYFHVVHMVSNVWVVVGGAKIEDRYGITGQYIPEHVYILNPSAEECVKRIASDDRRSSRLGLWRRLIRQWKMQYEPHSSDEFLPAYESLVQGVGGDGIAKVQDVTPLDRAG